MLIIPIDKSTIYIRLHETIVLTMKPKASTNHLQGISSVRKAKNNPSYCARFSK